MSSADLSLRSVVFRARQGPHMRSSIASARHGAEIERMS